MADLRLELPQSGQRIELSAAEDARIVLDFPIDQAIMSREDNSSALTFSFDDGSSIVISNFYDTYTSDNMPDFIIEGQVIDGESFFASFDDNLMPAAGPAAAAVAIRGGGNSDFGNDALGTGLDSLDGLGISGASTEVNPLPMDGSSFALNAAAGDSTLGLTPPVTPEVPPVDNDVIITDNDAVTVKEADMVDGKVTVNGTLKIDAADGLASVTIDGNEFKIGKDGEISSDLTDNTFNVKDADGNVVGTFTVKGYNTETGVLSYEYTQTVEMQHGDKNAIGSEDTVDLPVLDVIVTDKDGSKGETTIEIIVEDDGPTIGEPTIEEIKGDSESIGNDINIDFEVLYGDTVNGNEGTQKLDQNIKQGGVTITAVKVTTDKDGNLSTSEHANITLAYRQNREGEEGEAKDQGCGLSVSSGTGDGSAGPSDWDEEIGSKDATTSEGVLFALPEGQLSYDFTINLQAFFPKDGGYDGDEEFDTEIVTLTFYTYDADGNSIVAYTVDIKADLWEGEDTLGVFSANLPNGYNSVLVSPKHNGSDEGSSFLINSVDFGALPEGDVLSTFEGKVNFDIGADDGAGSGIAFNYADGDKILGNITVKIELGGDGSSNMTGEDASGNTVFVAYLNPYGEWTLHAYQDMPFDLGFIVTDSDGDTATTEVSIDVNFDVNIVENAGVIVDEAGIGADIEANADGSATATGSFTIKAADGVASVTIAGNKFTIDENGNITSDLTDNTFNVMDESGKVVVGTFTVKNYSTETGVLSYEYTQTAGVEHDGKNAIGEDDTVTLPPLDVIVTDKDGSTAETEIKITVEDGNPTISKVTHENIVDNSNYIEDVITIDFESIYSEDIGDDSYFVIVEPEIILDGVTISAVKVTTDENGKLTNKPDIGNIDLAYSQNPDGPKGCSGLTVDSGGVIPDLEIGNKDTTTSEGILFELPGNQLSYSCTINLGAFFSDARDSGSEDFVSEIVLLSFYKGGILVHTETITSTSANGVFTGTYLVTGGYDSVLISPKHNGDSHGSSFVVNGIEFGDLPEGSIFSSSEGKVIFDVGADEGAGSGIAFDYEDGQKIVSTIGTITIGIESDTNNTSTMTGKVGDVIVFVATLEPDGSWTFVANQGFSVVDGDFKLGFVAKDSDGDEARTEVNVDVSVNEIEIEMDDDGNHPEVWGTLDKDDIIYGSDEHEQIHGLGGDDIIFGGGGHDLIFGGTGNDQINGGSGNDYIEGRGGADKIYGGSGSDIIIFEDGQLFDEQLFVDGGVGTDFVLGVSCDMDDILANIDKFTGIEVFIAGDERYLDNLETIGITVDSKGNAEFGDEWTKGDGEIKVVNDGQNYYEVTYKGEEGDGITALINQTLFDTFSS